MLDFIRREPIACKAVLIAAFVLLATFVPFTPEQRQAALEFIAALTLLLGAGARSMVTPNSKLPESSGK